MFFPQLIPLLGGCSESGKSKAPLDYFLPMRISALALAALGLIGYTSNSLAASNGTDDASASAYSGGWNGGTDGSTGGDGFLPWNLTTSGTAGFEGFFIGDSKSLGSHGANINVINGDSFGLYGNQDPSASALAQRMFTSYVSTIGGLSSGQTFSISIAVNFRNGNKGINLLSADGSTSLFDLNIGGDNYVVNDATTGDGTLSTSYQANTSFLLSFTQTTGTHRHVDRGARRRRPAIGDRHLHGRRCGLQTLYRRDQPHEQ